MTRTSKIDAPWLVMGPEPFLATCQRCGKQEVEPDLPLYVDAVVAYLRYLCVKHRHCQPEKVAS